MIFVFALSFLGIQCFRHSQHDEKPMGADDWVTEIDIGAFFFIFYPRILTIFKVIGEKT